MFKKKKQKIDLFVDMKGILCQRKRTITRTSCAALDNQIGEWTDRLANLFYRDTGTFYKIMLNKARVLFLFSGEMKRK